MTIRPDNYLSSSPKVTEMRVVPVAGHDGMLLNLSGAHAPFFTRNIVIVRDNSGHTGVGEVPGGEQIRQTLEDARQLVVGRSIGAYSDSGAGERQDFVALAGTVAGIDKDGKMAALFYGRNDGEVEGVA